MPLLVIWLNTMGTKFSTYVHSFEVVYSILCKKFQLKIYPIVEIRL